MAESTRAVLASVDETLTRIRSRIGAPQDDASKETAAAFRVADEWARHVEHLVLENRLTDAARQFRAQWPALVRWRERVLQNPRKSKPAIVAAAFESLALECTLAGEMELAAKAQQAAIDVMRRRGVVPIRSETTVSGAQAQSA